MVSAGAKTYADDINDLWSNQLSAATQLAAATYTNSSTTFAVLATISSFTFKAGIAYEAWFGGNFGSSVAGNRNHFRLYKTNTSGTDYGEYGRYYYPAATSAITSAQRTEGRIILRRSASSDLTATVVLAWAPVSIGSGNEARGYSGSSYPIIFGIRPIGDNSDYSGIGTDVT